MKKLSVFFTVILFILCIALSSCGNTPDVTSPAAPDGQTGETTPENTPNGEKPLVSLLHNSVDVLSVGVYSGDFIENGKNETAESTVFAALKNNGEKALRLLEFEISDGETGYSFSVTSFLPGAELTVLEKNGKTAKNGLKAKSINITNVEFFDELPSTNEDIFSVSCAKNRLEVKNLSDTDISDGCIYLKRFSDGVYFGGITYRIKTGEIKAGEAKTIELSELDPSVCRVVFTTFDK